MNHIQSLFERLTDVRNGHATTEAANIDIILGRNGYKVVPITITNLRIRNTHSDEYRIAVEEGHPEIIEKTCLLVKDTNDVTAIRTVLDNSQTPYTNVFSTEYENKQTVWVVPANKY